MITFFSNFINEHQIPFCNAMYEKTNGNFRFVATEPISEERLSMKFVDRSEEFPYVVRSFLNDESYNEAMRLAKESDVVIIGSAPDEFIVDRLKENKLTFRYCERFFKKGKIRILDPRVFRARYLGDIRYRKKNLHMLCASAYTAPDCRFIKSYPNKTYKWGYFPSVKKYDDIDLLIKNKKPASILWAGRLIPLKHPEIVIEMAKKLKERNIDFTVTIVGEGILKEKLLNQIRKYSLTDYIEVEGFIPSKQLRKKMEQADIYFFTSDHNEGWGAVLNESMNSACAVVACKEIGSVPYLIENDENGLIYDRRRRGDLTNKVVKLLSDKEFKLKLQKKAYETLINTWNADSAAERLLNLIEDINNDREPRYTFGPCSRD